MMLLGYKDYPTDEIHVAKTQIPQKNSTEGKSEYVTVLIKVKPTIIHIHMHRGALCDYQCPFNFKRKSTPGC